MRLAPAPRTTSIARKEKPALGRRGMKRKATEEAKTGATLKQLDGFYPVWGRGTHIKAWRVWCNWEGSEDEWTAELVDESSLLPEQRKQAKSMMQKRKTKLIYPWPTMRTRREYLNELGFRAYRTDKRGPWKCQKMSEFNDEDGMIGLPDTADEAHSISVRDFNQKSGLFFDSDSDVSTYEADSENEDRPRRTQILYSSADSETEDSA